MPNSSSTRIPATRKPPKSKPAPELRRCETCKTAILARDRAYRGEATTLCKRCGQKADRDKLRGHYVVITTNRNRAVRRWQARHPEQMPKPRAVPRLRRKLEVAA